MKKILALSFILFLFNCTKNAEVTQEGAGFYADEKLQTKIADLSKGTVVEALDYRNHAWNVRDSIKIKYNSQVGYVSPRSLVVGQNPEKSVFKWGYRADYKPFLDPNDKARYKHGFEYPQLKNVPKTKVPLEQLLEGSKLD